MNLVKTITFLWGMLANRHSTTTTAILFRGTLQDLFSDDYTHQSTSALMNAFDRLSIPQFFHSPHVLLRTLNNSFDQFFHHWHLSIRLDEQYWLRFLLKGMSKFSRINGRWTSHVFKTSLVSYNSLKCKFTSNKNFLSMGQALCHVTINDPISQ